jgi:hypothetical protein
LLAAFFSAIVSGVGQLFLGQRRKGSILLILFSALLFGFWPVRRLRFYPGLITHFSPWISLYIHAVCTSTGTTFNSSKQALQMVAARDPSVYLPDSQPRGNGEGQHEPHLQHAGPQWPDGMNDLGPVGIPSGKCFVMGDSRDISLDRSPGFGLVENGSIVGKPWYVFGSDRVGVSIR